MPNLNFLHAISGVAASVLRPLFTLAVMPLILKYYSEEELSTWLLTLSVIAVLSSLNSGLFNTSVDIVSRATTDESLLRDIYSLIKYACIVAIIFMGSALTIFYAIYITINYAVGSIIVIGVFVIAFGFANNTLLGILSGIGVHYIGQIILSICIITSGLSTIYLINHRYSFDMALLAFVFLPIFMSCIACFFVIIYRLKHINSRIDSDGSTSSYKQITDTLIPLTLHQGAHNLNQHLDIIIISIFFSSSAVASYGIAQRIFMLGAMLISPINNSLLSSFNRGTISISGRKRYLLFVVTFTMIFSISMYFLGNQISMYWMNTEKLLPLPILVYFGLWLTLINLNNTLEVFLKSRRLFIFMQKTLIIFTVVSLLIKLIFGYTFNSLYPMLYCGIILIFSLITLSYLKKLSRVGL